MVYLCVTDKQNRHTMASTLNSRSRVRHLHPLLYGVVSAVRKTNIFFKSRLFRNGKHISLLLWRVLFVCGSDMCLPSHLTCKITRPLGSQCQHRLKWIRQSLRIITSLVKAPNCADHITLFNNVYLIKVPQRSVEGIGNGRYWMHKPTK